MSNDIDILKSYTKNGSLIIGNFPVLTTNQAGCFVEEEKVKPIPRFIDESGVPPSPPLLAGNRVLVFEICNNNAKKDDNFDVIFNDVYLGNIDFSADYQFAYMFIGTRDFSFNVSSIETDFVCPLSLTTLYYFDFNIPLYNSQNTLRLVNTKLNNNGNEGTIGIRTYEVSNGSIRNPKIVSDIDYVGSTGNSFFYSFDINIESPTVYYYTGQYLVFRYKNVNNVLAYPRTNSYIRTPIQINYVGYCGDNGGANYTGAPEFNLPPDPDPVNHQWIHYGEDPVNTNQDTSVCIFIDNIKRTWNGDIHGWCEVWWSTNVGLKSINIEVDIYTGGTMSVINKNWVNTGGTLIGSFVREFSASKNGNCTYGDLLGWTYNTSSGAFTWSPVASAY